MLEVNLIQEPTKHTGIGTGLRPAASQSPTNLKILWRRDMLMQKLSLSENFDSAMYYKE